MMTLANLTTTKPLNFVRGPAQGAGDCRINVKDSHRHRATGAIMRSLTLRNLLFAPARREAPL